MRPVRIGVKTGKAMLGQEVRDLANSSPETVERITFCLSLIVVPGFFFFPEYTHRNEIACDPTSFAGRHYHLRKHSWLTWSLPAGNGCLYVQRKRWMLPHLGMNPRAAGLDIAGRNVRLHPCVILAPMDDAIVDEPHTRGYRCGSKMQFSEPKSSHSFIWQGGRYTSPSST